MEKRDTKTGMRSNEVNVRKLQQPGRRMSWNFGESIPGVLDIRVGRNNCKFSQRIEDETTIKSQRGKRNRRNERKKDKEKYFRKEIDKLGAACDAPP